MTLVLFACELVLNFLCKSIQQVLICQTICCIMQVSLLLVFRICVRNRSPKGREGRSLNALGPLGGKYRRRVSENMLACFRIRAEYLCRESPAPALAGERP